MAYTFVPTVPGEGFVEDIVGEVEVAEAGEGGESRRNGAEEFVCGEGEVEEEWEVGNVGGERGGEVHFGEVEGGDVVVVVADDVELGAIRDGGIPRRQNGWCGVSNG